MKEKKAVILIGPISGDISRAIKAFADAELKFTSDEYFVCHNPMRDHEAIKGKKLKSEAHYMKQSLSAICDAKDKHRENLLAVALPYSHKSLGAVCEVSLCEKLHIRIREAGIYS